MIRLLKRHRTRLICCCFNVIILLFLRSLFFTPSTYVDTITRKINWNVGISPKNMTHHVHLISKYDGAVMPVEKPPLDISPPMTSPYKLCAILHRGLGNQMFQFASLYGIAAKKGMSVTIDRKNYLTKVFKLKVDMKDNYETICRKFPTRHEKLDCSYDERLDAFQPNNNYRVEKYLQSWKYFYNYSRAIRKQFLFHDTIIEERNKIIFSILKKYNFKSRSDVTFIGIHIRRGNFINNTYGYNVASESYFRKAMNYFKLRRLKNTIFIICSNDMNWTKKHVIQEVRLEFIDGHSAGVDMALLGSCNHMITSVGTFSWWSGWLTRGEVTFYKWPAKEGSLLRKQFSKDYTDYFHPGWIWFS